MIKTRDKTWYSDRLIAEHRDKPRFRKTVEAVTGVPSLVQSVIAGLIDDYYLEIAEGVQLDAIGRWVGFSRNIQIDARGIYFSWSTTSDEGWDKGIWWHLGDGTKTLTKLKDDIYRKFIKAKIAANGWDGGRKTGYAIISAAYPDLARKFQIIDNGNMSFTLKFDDAVKSMSKVEILTIYQTKLFMNGAGINVTFSPPQSLGGS